MIDPVQSLAFAVQTHPGIYAPLIGSGVSRDAGIPTGWEIVQDLIRKLAVTKNEQADPKPEQWYLENFGECPDYSKLVNHLAKTPTERQQLLRPYFEPTDQEREEGWKQPTAAHKAIAYLVRQGFIKLIITTNFDRLIEKALEQEGVAPEVISSKAQLVGSVPLMHAQCRVFKIHGDYLDPGILNTPEELANYPNEYDAHLDRILDEFGLIVCGWSADWDIGLRNAIERAPNRRFTTYWATRDQPTESAQRLIDQRDAEVISISNADDFFESVRDTVESLQDFSRPHPLSTAAAVASLKRYLTNPEHKIRYGDLIDEVVAQVDQTTLEQDVNMNHDKERVSNELNRYEYSSSTLLSMAPLAGYWAEEYHYPAWDRALQRLIKRPIMNQWHTDLGLAVANYPARLTFYALGMGALASENLQFLNRLFRTEVRYKSERPNSGPALLALFNDGITGGVRWDQLLEGMSNGVAPLSRWVHIALREYLSPLIQDDERYDLIFDQLEILTSLGFAHLENETLVEKWYPFGTFLLRPENGQQVLNQFRDSISDTRSQSPWVQSGIFGDSPLQCEENLLSFKTFFNKFYDRNRFGRTLFT